VFINDHVADSVGIHIISDKMAAVDTDGDGCIYWDELKDPAAKVKLLVLEARRAIHLKANEIR